MMRNHVGVGFLGAVAIVLILAGCAPVEHVEPIEGAAAIWQLSDGAAVDADSEEIQVGVTRMECSGGVTGETLPPVVSYEGTRVIVRIDVEPQVEGIHACPGNDIVPVLVRLTEPLGDRTLVDGGCSHPDILNNVYCETPTRWGPAV